MNGTTLRVATAVACAAALAAPGSALAGKHHAHRSATARQQLIVSVPHIYDAGGNGEAPAEPAGVKANLFDPLNVAVSLGNNVLGTLGLPPLP